MEKYLNIEEINDIVEKNYNKKYDKLTAFIKDEDISEVLLKDKSATISPKVIRYIMGEYLNLKEIYKLDNVDNIGYSLDENSFRKALEKIYIASGKDNKTKNILYPYCIFASNEQINNLYKEAKDIASARFKYAAFMLEAIALNGTKTALNLVYEASKKFKQNTVRFTCKAILNFFFIFSSSLSTILIPFESKSKSGTILSAKTSSGICASFIIKFKIALQVSLTVFCLNFFEAS